jgi:transglutaminase-like putative cysteine protease
MPRRLHRLRAARISLLAWTALAGLAAAQATAPVEAPAAAPAAKPSFEEWTLLYLAGKTCGFGSTITTPVQTPQGPGYRTELQEEFVVKRLGTTLKLNEVSHVMEDARGVVLSFDQISSGMGSNIEESGTREGDDLVVSSRGQVQRFHVPPLTALGPEVVRRATDAVPLKAGTKFSLNTFETDCPQSAAAQEGMVVGQENHEVNGVTRKLWKIVSDESITPGLTSINWVDDAYNDVETDVTLPGLGEMRQIVTDRATCMKQPEGAEIFATSLIAPQRAIANIEHQGQAFYRITTNDKQKLKLWNQGEQLVLKSGPGSAEIEVTVPRWRPEDADYTLPHADTPELHPYLQPSAYLESASPEIRQLALDAVGRQTNPVRAAHRIERFVEYYITKKDLNVGFASAEETARSHEGDCTEHAVLCAAIGRAAGLPTRCVLGLGYIPPGEAEPTISNAVDTKTGIFGFHMWAEADIGHDRWVPMDAALGGFDVGHIAIFKSALADINPMVDLNMPILTLLENLRITVLKTVPKNTPAPPTVAPVLQAPPTVPAVSTPAPAAGPSPASSPTID